MTGTRTAMLALGMATMLVAPSARAQDSVLAPPPPADSALLRGAYTDEQAKRGQGTFSSRCTACHAASTHTGTAFVRLWVERTAFDLFDLIRTRMPDDSPGSLTAREYIDIVAYLFSLNGYPAGTRQLEPDDALLRLLRIDAPPAVKAPPE